jgi:hypothetical protein
VVHSAALAQNHIRHARPRRRAIRFTSVFSPEETDWRLLIVAPDFFIQRCAGEVAEWSKALPC